MGRILTRAQRSRRDGARAAQREHLRLGTPMDRRVEIFEVIEWAGIWLMFQPLRELFGASQRRGDAAGIIINSNHPLSLQRSTAAHEYGHYVLGHDLSLDREQHIEGWVGTLKAEELSAQAFASEFLMPLQLVNYVLRQLGFSIRPRQLSAEDVYRLSLELGASYAASVNQLVALKKLSPIAARGLRKQRPIVIKEGLAGERPRNARADVWLLDESLSGREFAVRVDDEIHIRLLETPSSGYRWELESSPPDGSGLEVIQDSFEPGEQTDSGTYGLPGRHHVLLRVTEPGEHVVRLIKRRPWRTPEAVSGTFEARLRTARMPTGEMDRGLSEDQKPLLVAV